jgi:hypothetical protein
LIAVALGVVGTHYYKEDGHDDADWDNRRFGIMACFCVVCGSRRIPAQSCSAPDKDWAAARPALTRQAKAKACRLGCSTKLKETSDDD